MALGAGAAAMRWGIMAQTADVTTLALIEPLHGLTFALFHLGCMRIIADTVPSSLAGMAQAFYGTVGIGGSNGTPDRTFRLAVRALGDLPDFGEWPYYAALAFPIIWSLHVALSQNLNR